MNRISKKVSFKLTLYLAKVYECRMDKSNSNQVKKSTKILNRSGGIQGWIKCKEKQKTPKFTLDFSGGKGFDKNAKGRNHNILSIVQEV